MANAKSNEKKSILKCQDYRGDVAARLCDSGISAQAAEALLDFDAEMFRLMRRMVKGELPTQLMAELDQGIELAQFQTLTAILRIKSGLDGRDPTEATIGMVALEMNIDPSRASRLVADLIAAGLLRRDVSQTDGRKSVLGLTEKADALLTGFRDLKWTKTMQAFDGWSEPDILNFSQLFLRYNSAIRRVYRARD